MPWARASSLQRHLECPAASWLPRFDRGVWSKGYLADETVALPSLVPPISDTSAADWGTAMHAAKEGGTDACDPWLSSMAPWREKLWPRDLGQHETAVAYDCRTGQVKLGPHGLPVAEMNAWKAAQGPDCVTGTADWWAVLPTGEPWIDDLKTGRHRPEVVTPQMLFYAMTKVKLDKASTCRLSITHWPKAADAPSREGLWMQVTSTVLDLFEDDVVRAWKRAITSPDARPGSHCRFCPSATVCDRAFE